VIARDLDTTDTAVVGGTVLIGVIAAVGASRSTDTGPILAFVGAILVALLTAYTAHKRQKVGLAAEAARLDQQLEAESERHRERLAHELRIADMTELRTILDEVLRLSYAAQRAAREFEAAAAVAVLAKIERQNLFAGMYDRVLTAGMGFSEASMELNPYHDVIPSRLLLDHQITEAFRRLTDAHSDFADLVPTDGRESATPEWQASITEWAERVTKAHRDLLDRVAETIRSCV
jgi:hypothetical protein